MVSPAVPGLVAQFHLTDAIFQPGIAAHQASARQFGAAAARNNTLRDAAVPIWNLCGPKHALAIAREALENTENLTDLTRQYAATGQGLQSDHKRLEAELALRQEDLVAREEGVQVASAAVGAGPARRPFGADRQRRADRHSAGDRVPGGWRGLLCGDGAVATSRTGGTKTSGVRSGRTTGAGEVRAAGSQRPAGNELRGLGGGLGSAIVNTNDRWDADAVAYWEIRNLGFGERAARREARSQQRQAQMREVALLDGVAREVVESHAQVVKRRQRIELAPGVEAAHKSYTLNVQRIENAQGLPIETLQAIQALANAQRAYLNAVVDYNVPSSNSVAPSLVCGNLSDARRNAVRRGGRRRGSRLLRSGGRASDQREGEAKLLVAMFGVLEEEDGVHGSLTCFLQLRMTQTRQRLGQDHFISSRASKFSATG